MRALRQHQQRMPPRVAQVAAQVAVQVAVQALALALVVLVLMQRRLRSLVTSSTWMLLRAHRPPQCA